MDQILRFDYARHYKVLLEPFRNSAFGPELATALLVVAAIILISFLASAIPKAVRLRFALSAINAGRSSQETEQQKRANFQSNYKKNQLCPVLEQKRICRVAGVSKDLNFQNY